MSRSSQVFLLAGLFLLALLLRLLPALNFPEQSLYVFWGADSYDHLRRTLLLVEHFPQAMEYNYYQGFPKGTFNFWPPLMHYCVAIVSSLIALGRPDVKTVEAVAAFIPAVWGALCVFPLYYIGKLIFGRLAGFFAAAMLAVLPAHLGLTLFGVYDNNALEPLLAISFLCCVHHALNKNVRGLSDDVSLKKEDYKNALRGAIIGIVGWLCLFSWRGSIVFLGVIEIYGVYLLVKQFSYEVKSRVSLTMLAAINFVCLLMSSPFVLTSTWGARNIFDFGVISRFHLYLFGGFGLVFFLAMRTQTTAGFFVSPKRRIVFSVGMAATLLTALLFNSERFFQAATYFFNFFLGQSQRWGIAEFRPLFWHEGQFELSTAYEMFGLSLPIAVVSWLLLLYRNFHERFSSDTKVFFLLWTFVFLCVGIFRYRFINLTALAVCLLVGSFCGKMLGAKARDKVFRPIAMMALLFFLLIGHSSIAFIRALPTSDNKLPITDDLFSALQWMEKNTPSTSNYNSPWEKPEYSVLAIWSFGSWVEYLSKRPAVATPWGNETYGLDVDFDYHLAQDFVTVDKLLVDNGVKYLVSTNPLIQISDFSEYRGISKATFFDEIKQNDRIHYMLNESGVNLASVRLFFNDGLPVLDWRNPPGNLRLIYESQGTMKTFINNQMTSVLKVFERVEGAVVTGMVRRGDLVEIGLRLKTNRGRIFIWRTQATADEDGRFQFKVPYATSRNRAVEVVNPYVVYVNGKLLCQLEVEDSAIESGEALKCGI